MADPFILVDKSHPHIAIITLNRPEKRNALNITLLQELCEQVESLDKDPGVRVLIFNGAGAVFCAGLDMKEAVDPASENQSAHLIEKAIRMINQCGKATIAAVHGAAMAGGAGLLAPCDLVMAAQGTIFGYPEVRRGLVAALVSVLLSRQVREREMRELLLTGESVSAERALEMGLINRIVSPEDLIPAALKMAQSVIKGAPESIAESKKLINRLNHANLEHDFQLAREYHLRARGSSSSKEGLKAFLEKRDPVW